MDISNPKSKDYDPDQGVDWAGVIADWAAREDPPAYDAYVHDSDTEKILKEVTRHDALPDLLKYCARDGSCQHGGCSHRNISYSHHQ